MVENPRYQTLDVVRGVAILGILLANMGAFAGPVFSVMTGAAEDVIAQSAPTESLLALFVTGKFRSTLAILFGVGLWLQFRKREGAGRSWPGSYLRRILFLGLIGVAHGLLIWWGDILFSYAVVGAIACLFARASDTVLLVVSTVLLGLSGAFCLLWIAVESLMSGSAAGMSSAADPLKEIAIFANGSFADMVQARAVYFGINAASMPFLIPSLLPMFLLGILYGRRGVLFAPSQHPKIRNLALAVGFGLGLPLNAIALFYWHNGLPMSVYMSIEIFAGPIMALGYSMLAATLAERATGVFSSSLAKVGKLALSNYLLQSIVCTTIFYSYGLGLFGDLNNLESLAFVPLVWLFNLAFSFWWSRRYRLGPVEWLWRSLDEGRRLPLKS